jgi:hypothetical protein
MNQNYKPNPIESAKQVLIIYIQLFVIVARYLLK